MGCRNRTINPGVWTDEDFLELELPAQMLWIGMISHADDRGRLPAGPRSLRATILSGHDFTIEQVCAWRDEIVRRGMACLYEVDGSSYLHLPNWKRYQYVNRPAPSTIPPCPRCDARQNTDSICSADAQHRVVARQIPSHQSTPHQIRPDQIPTPQMPREQAAVAHVSRPHSTVRDLVALPVSPHHSDMSVVFSAPLQSLPRLGDSGPVQRLAPAHHDMMPEHDVMPEHQQVVAEYPMTEPMAERELASQCDHAAVHNRENLVEQEEYCAQYHVPGSEIPPAAGLSIMDQVHAEMLQLSAGGTDDAAVALLSQWSDGKTAASVLETWRTCRRLAAAGLDWKYGMGKALLKPTHSVSYLVATARGRASDLAGGSSYRISHNQDGWYGGTSAWFTQLGHYTHTPDIHRAGDAWAAHQTHYTSMHRDGALAAHNDPPSTIAPEGERIICKYTSGKYGHLVH